MMIDKEEVTFTLKKYRDTLSLTSIDKFINWKEDYAGSTKTKN
jgi:hypothetical protein